MRALAGPSATFPIGTDVISVPGEGFVAAVPDGRVLIMDTDVEVVCALRDVDEGIGTSSFGRARNRAAISGFTGVHYFDLAGTALWTFRHANWRTDFPRSGACHIDTGGNVWALIPDRRWEDQVVVLDGEAGSIIANLMLDDLAVGAVFVDHPDRGLVGLSISMGQDGHEMWWLRLVGNRIHVEGLVRSKEHFSALAPDGSVSWVQDDITTRSLAVPSGDELAQLKGRAVAGDDFLFEDGPIAISESLGILAIADEDWERCRHFLIDIADLKVLEEIDYGGIDADYLLQVAGSDRWATYRKSRGCLAVWGLGAGDGVSS